VPTEWTVGEWSDSPITEWLGDTISVDSMRCVAQIDVATVWEIISLIVRDAECGVAIAQPTAVYADLVVPAGLDCAVSTEQTSLTGLVFFLWVNGVDVAVALEEEAFKDLKWDIVANGISVGILLDEAIDVGLNAIDPADLACAVAIERATPIPIDLIISRSLDVATRLDQVTVNFIPSLVVNDLGCGIVIEVPRTSAVWGIYPEDLRCYIYLDEVDFPSFGREADTAIKSGTKKYSIELG